MPCGEKNCQYGDQQCACSCQHRRPLEDCLPFRANGGPVLGQPFRGFLPGGSPGSEKTFVLLACSHALSCLRPNSFHWRGSAARSRPRPCRRPGRLGSTHHGGGKNRRTSSGSWRVSASSGFWIFAHSVRDAAGDWWGCVRPCRCHRPRRCGTRKLLDCTKLLLHAGIGTIKNLRRHRLTQHLSGAREVPCVDERPYRSELAILIFFFLAFGLFRRGHLQQLSHIGVWTEPAQSLLREINCV